MANKNSRIELSNFIENLYDIGVGPKSIQMAQWYNWSLASCFDDKGSLYISESVSMGIDPSPEIAMWKAIVEFCERKFAKESNDLNSRLTLRSDGFAAYPILNSKAKAFKLAQENARDEIIERFCWATWWDNRNTYYTFSNPPKCLEVEFEMIKKDFQVVNLNEIRIPSNSPTQELSILIAENKDGGFITGGACSTHHRYNERIRRAFGELLRHLLALKRIKSDNNTSLSFYERRLLGFGSGEFRDITLDRLKFVGEETIQLSELIADRPIEHTYSDIVQIHRCLLKNQPVFLGGNIARLCI